MKIFLFFGRLERSKGADIILTLSPVDYAIIVFGKGEYSSHFEKYSRDKKTLPTLPGVYYGGWATKEEISYWISQSDATIMPSRFVETFGLSALESLSRGKRVIGYKHAGLEQFVTPEDDLFAVSGKTEGEKLDTLLHNFTPRPLIDISHYTEQAWVEKLESYQPGERVLLVSDFTKQIGGIETFLHHISHVMSNHNKKIKIEGFQGEVTKKTKLIGLIIGRCNIGAFFHLMKTIHQFSPTVIRFHSILRRLGPMALIVPGRKWIMIHDMGYFCTYPSVLTDHSKIGPSFKDFHNAGNKLLGLYKWLYVKLVWKAIEKCEIIFVPSEFMIPIVKKFSSVRCEVFSHMTQ